MYNVVQYASFCYISYYADAMPLKGKPLSTRLIRGSYICTDLHPESTSTTHLILRIKYSILPVPQSTFENTHRFPKVERAERSLHKWH